MFTQNRCRVSRRYLALETFPHCRSLALIGHDRENMPRLQDLTNAHRDCLPGNICQSRKPSFSKLLPAAGVIEINDQVRRLCVKVRRRIVERKMPILADANKGKINRRLCKRRTRFRDYLCRRPGSVQKVIVPYSCLFNESLAKIAAKARRMILPNADIFIQMEHFHLVPLDSWLSGKRLEKLELRGHSGCDQPRISSFLYRLTQQAMRPVRRRLGELVLRRKDGKLHC